MIVKNTSGGALAPTSQTFWPAVDTDRNYALDAQYRLLDGATVQLTQNNSLAEQLQDPELQALFDSGDLTLIVRGIEIGPGVEIDLETLTGAPRDGQTYAQRDGGFVAFQPASNNRGFLLSNNQNVYADGASGTNDPDDLAGWYFNNEENQKINWYFFGNTDPSGPRLETWKGAYAVVNIKATGANLFFNLYTQRQFDGNDAGSFYRSRINYTNETGSMALTPGRYLVHTSDADVRGIETGLDRLVLSVDEATSVGPRGATETLFLLALSTSSNRPANSDQFTVEAVSYGLGGAFTRFDLLASSAPATSTAGTFRGEVATDGQLSNFINPLEGDYAAVESTASLWRYSGGVWADDTTNAIFQSWVAAPAPTAAPSNIGVVNVDYSLSANMALDAITGQHYRTGTQTSGYNIAGLVSQETIANANEYFEFDSLVINYHCGFGLASIEDIEGTGANENGYAVPGELWNHADPTMRQAYSGRSAMVYFSNSGAWTYGATNGGGLSYGSFYQSTQLQGTRLFAGYGGGGGATVRVGLNALREFYVAVLDGLIFKTVYKSTNPLPSGYRYKFVFCANYFQSRLSQLPTRTIAPVPVPAGTYQRTHYINLDPGEDITFSDTSAIANVLDYSQDFSFGFEVAEAWLPNTSQTALSNGGNSFYLSYNTGNVGLYLTSAGAFNYGVNTWHSPQPGDRYAVTYDATTRLAKFYINGVYKSSRTMAAGNAADGVIKIGSGGTYSGNLNGGIDEVWFSPRVLDFQEVGETAGNPTTWSFYDVDVTEFLLMGEDAFPNVEGLKGVLSGQINNGESNDFKPY